MSLATSFHEPRQKPGRSRVVWIGRCAGREQDQDAAGRGRRRRWDGGRGRTAPARGFRASGRSRRRSRWGRGCRRARRNGVGSRRSISARRCQGSSSASSGSRSSAVRSRNAVRPIRHGTIRSGGSRHRRDRATARRWCGAGRRRGRAARCCSATEGQIAADVLGEQLRGGLSGSVDGDRIVGEHQRADSAAAAGAHGRRCRCVPVERRFSRDAVGEQRFDVVAGDRGGGADAAGGGGAGDVGDDEEGLARPAHRSARARRRGRWRGG